MNRYSPDWDLATIPPAVWKRELERRKKVHGHGGRREGSGRPSKDADALKAKAQVLAAGVHGSIPYARSWSLKSIPSEAWNAEKRRRAKEHGHGGARENTGRSMTEKECPRCHQMVTGPEARYGHGACQPGELRSSGAGRKPQNIDAAVLNKLRRKFPNIHQVTEFTKTVYRIVEFVSKPGKAKGYRTFYAEASGKVVARPKKENE